MVVKMNIEAVHDALYEEMKRDNRIIVMGEDVGRDGGVFRATEGLYKEFGEARVIDSPLAESGIIGAAIGMALNGLIPVAEIQFADFIYPAVDQIISEAAKLRYRSGGAFGCPMVIRTPYGGGVRGGLYHSQSVEAVFTNTPGLKIVAPSTPYDIKGLLKAAIRDPDPVLFLEHKRTYRLIRGEVPEEDYVLPIGKADVKRPGKDLTVISYGLMLHFCLEAAERLGKEGVEVEVVDPRTLVPLDKETILASVKKTGKALVVYEANRTGGFGAEIAATIAEEAFDYLDGPVTRLAGPDVPAMPYNSKLEALFLPSVDKISEAMRKLAGY
ncbi:MAG: alpha-ketoacid dehydrogenase subunit beta [Dehalococcoidia bacterium]|nr:alpha-ketoacid dehydrogenase subunit beta [Dehalococcoidia bacterium]